jgi:hypothetical protein
MNKRRLGFTLVLILIFTLVLSTAALAFQDLPEGTTGEKILKLKQDKVINGINAEEFAPNAELTNAGAMQMIVNAFHINLAHFTFIKQPLASDYYTSIPDDAWYANAFMVAQLNGIEGPKDIDPNKKITREEYTHYLFEAMKLRADFVFIELFNLIEDEEQITDGYMDSIQKMLIAGIVSLDDKQNFYPQETLTRAEAAVMLHDAIVFTEEHGSEPTGLEPDPLEPNHPLEPRDEDVTVTPDEDVNYEVVSINDQVNEITVDWGTKPNSGYSLTIDKIEFDDANAKAVIYYTTHQPDPDSMYLQVITYPKAVTYVSSQYEVSIQPM